MRSTARPSALFVSAVFSVLALPVAAQRAPVALDSEWFKGLGDAGVCTALPANAAFVAKSLTHSGKAERRVALVVGNGGYFEPAWKLANPRNDAAGIARFLQSVGFEVHALLDGTAAAIEACAAKAAASTADVSLLYYSGHGVQVEYGNYLVGTDVARKEARLTGLVSVDALVARLRSNGKATLAFLDACRDNPMANKGAAGLAPEQVAPKALRNATGDQPSPQSTGSGAALSAGELFVAFATSPNTTASDGTGSFSPFTESMLRHGRTPGWTIQRLVAEVTKDVGEATNWTQTPWSRSSLTRQIHFNGAVDPDAALRASNLKAAQSAALLAKGDRQAAILIALQGLPEKFGDDDIKTYREAYEALYRATRSRSLRLPVAEPVHTTFSVDGRFVATVSQNLGATVRKEALTLWSAVGAQKIAELLPTDRSGTRSTTLGPGKFSADGRRFVHTDPKSEQPIVWDTNTGLVVKTLPTVLGATRDMTSVPELTLSPSGRYLLADGLGISLYDVETGKIVWKGPGNLITAAAGFSADESEIVLASSGGSVAGGEHQTITVEAFGMSDKRPRWSKKVSERTWGVYGLFPSPDGRWVAITTSSDALILVATTGTETRRILMPRAGVGGVSFSPDGKYVAAISDDQGKTKVIAFSLETAQRVELPLEQHPHIDAVFSDAGEEVGVPYLPDTGDLWRKGVTGPGLFDAALAALRDEQRAALAKERVSFK